MRTERSSAPRRVPAPRVHGGLLAAAAAPRAWAGAACCGGRSGRPGRLGRRGPGDRRDPAAARRGWDGHPVGDPRRPDDGSPWNDRRPTACWRTSPHPRPPPRSRRGARPSRLRRSRRRRSRRRHSRRRSTHDVARRGGRLTGRRRGCLAVPGSFTVRRGFDDRVDQACLAQTLGSFDPHRLRDLLQLREELSLQRAAIHGVHRCPASLSSFARAVRPGAFASRRGSAPVRSRSVGASRAS